MINKSKGFGQVEERKQINVCPPSGRMFESYRGQTYQTSGELKGLFGR